MKKLTPTTGNKICRSMPFVAPLLALLFTIGTLFTGESYSQEKEQNLAFADLLFEQKQYEKAVRQYQIFIRENADSPNAQSGWFRLGECYLQLSWTSDAKTTFEHVVRTFKQGPYVGSAAFRLAVISFNAKDYTSAVGNFELATRESNAEDVRHKARYYHARSLQLTKNYDGALKSYQEVINKEGEFYERSMLESARIHSDHKENSKQRAFELFQELANKAPTESIREEAIVRGGLIASELGDIRASEGLLNQALSFSDRSSWKSLAQVGAIFNSFSNKDYRRVVDIYSSGALTNTIEEYRPKMLYVVAESYRMLGQQQDAARIYSMVENRYATSKEGMISGYNKLQILYQNNNSTLPSEARRYIATMRKHNADNANLDMAYLMLAEYHFSEAEKAINRQDQRNSLANYKASAAAYSQVRELKVDEKFRPIRLYKQGWAHLEASELQNGILAISRYIKRFPEHQYASSALAKRGMTYQSIKDYTFALSDFQNIIDKFPRSPELQLAMQQKALIFAHKRDLPKMIDAYEQLLRRFPDTPGKAEAKYWIGVGHFDMERFPNAIDALEQARREDPKQFGSKALVRIVLSHYQLEQIPELEITARAYIEQGKTMSVDQKNREKRFPIPKPVLEYLGKTLARDNKLAEAEYFLTYMCDFHDPSKTALSTWKILGDTRLKIQKYTKSIEAYDNFMGFSDEPVQKGYAFLQRSKAYLGLQKYDSADWNAKECLKLIKQGKLSGEAREVIGDAALGLQNLESALKEYIFVSELFDDEEITPRSMVKAIQVLEALGRIPDAAELRSKLQATYPDYRPPAELANPLPRVNPRDDFSTSVQPPVNAVQARPTDAPQLQPEPLFEPQLPPPPRPRAPQPQRGGIFKARPITNPTLDPTR